MAKVMQWKCGDTFVTLGAVTTAGAVHAVDLTAEGQQALQSNPPDSLLCVIDGHSFQVRATYVRNNPDGCRIVDDAAALAPTAAPEGDGDASVYASMSKADLVDQCEKRGLPKSGTKADMVTLLEADDADDGD